MNNNVFTAKNTFSAGLIQDLAPDNTQATCMTNALNATLKTNNGNELSLQNDMGNSKVEHAQLPKGYVPVGTCEFGGIIYIAAYNPLENKSQLGCFPSPERLLSNQDQGLEIQSSLNLFKDNDIITRTKCITPLTNVKLHPGDEYQVKYDSLEENPLILNTLGVLDSNNKFIPLKDYVFGEKFNVYASPYVSELYLQSILDITTDFSVDYEFKVNQDISIYPIFKLNGNIGHTYKVIIEKKTRAQEQSNEYEFSGIEYTDPSKPFYIGNDEQVSFTFKLYVKLNGNFYLIQDLIKIINIDLSKVGKGECKISKWRHFDNGNSTILDFLVFGDPRPNQELSNLTLTFSEIYPSNQENVFILNYPSEQYNKSEYIIIDYGVDYQNSTMLGTLQKDKVYTVNFICKDTSNKILLNEDRILYTCPIFNEFWDKNMYKFLYESEIGIDEGLVQDYKNIPFKDDAGYVHGFKRNGKNINPLQITIEPQIELLNTESTNYSENLDFTGDLIYDQQPTNIVKAIYTTSDSLNATVKITPKITSEFGDTFFKDIEFKYQVNNLSNVKTNEEITLTNIPYQFINSANLEFQQQSILQYNFIPVITNKNDLEKFGLNIDEGIISTNYNSFKAIDQYNSGEFKVNTIVFNNTWRSPNEYIETSYSSMENNNPLMSDNLQNQLSDNYKILVPITIGRWNKKTPEKYLNDVINTSFIGPFRSNDIGFNKIYDSPYKIIETIAELDENKDLFWREKINDVYQYGRIWWMLMKDEKDKYVPLNWFNYHRPYDLSETTNQKPTIQTVFDEKYEPVGIAQELVNLLATIYKPNGLSTNILKYIPTNAVFNELITEIFPRINITIINNFTFDNMPWQISLIENNYNISVSNINKFQSYLNETLNNKSYCAFDNTSLINSGLNTIEYQYGLDPNQLCYFNGINYQNIDENLPYRNATITLNELDNSKLKFDFGNLKEVTTYTEIYDESNNIYKSSILNYSKQTNIEVDKLGNTVYPIQINKIPFIEYDFYNVSSINKLKIKITTYDVFKFISTLDDTLDIYDKKYYESKDANLTKVDDINKYIKISIIIDDQETEQLSVDEIEYDDAVDKSILTCSLSNIINNAYYKHINVKIEFLNSENKTIYVDTQYNFNIQNVAQTYLEGSIEFYVPKNTFKATIGKYLTYIDGKVLLSASAKDENQVYLWNPEQKNLYFNRELVISPYTSL